MRNFVLFAICALSTVYAVDITDCGSTAGRVLKVEVLGCTEEMDKCPLKRNTNETVEITFIPDVNVKTVRAVVHGILLDVPIPFNLPQPDGCLNSGLICPLEAGKTYTYTATLPILRKYPRVTVDVKWELVDQDSKDITCSLIPAKIV